MSDYLLDTSALLTLRSDEAGAGRVAELLAAAGKGEVTCHGCFISLMEVLYCIWKREGEATGREAYAACLDLPIVWAHESPALLERAAGIKAGYPLSLADAWIAAAAMEAGATLVHKDPEFERVSGLVVERLPYK